ncbi:MAG: toprim domain-containing protein [Turicibacter sp.]|nr:toprim domain-containing protein [Turicibacter sp.]
MGLSKADFEAYYAYSAERQQEYLKKQEERSQKQEDYLWRKKQAQALSVPLEDFVLDYEGSRAFRDGKNIKVRHSDGRVDKSFVVSNGFFNDFNGKIKGGKTAVDYLTNYRKMDYQTAVETIHAVYYNLGDRPHTPTQIQKPQLPKEKGPILIPPKAPNNDKTIAYLHKERGISLKIINDAIERGAIFQTNHYYKYNDETKKHELHEFKGGGSNTVYVGEPTDPPKFACTRSNHNKTDRKQVYALDCTNSSKEYNFCVLDKPKNNDLPEAVSVFEAAIDAMSAATMDVKNPNAKQKTMYSAIHKLSSSGASSVSKVLEHFLRNNPNVTTVNLCLDNDEAGRTAAKRATQMLERLGKELGKEYTIQEKYPKIGKDWNECLLAIQKVQKRRGVEK